MIPYDRGIGRRELSSHVVEFWGASAKRLVAAWRASSLLRTRQSLSSSVPDIDNGSQNTLDYELGGANHKMRCLLNGLPCVYLLLEYLSVEPDLRLVGQFTCLRHTLRNHLVKSPMRFEVGVIDESTTCDRFDTIPPSRSAWMF